MNTLIISDLHLGSNSRTDLLRRPDLRSALLAELAGVDRLVLLGDVLELRHGPLREALAAARPLFEDLGRALRGRDLVITAGNHDHALVEPWLESRGREGEQAPPLTPEQLVEPAQASPAMATLAGWAASGGVGSVRVAYPGLWVRPDVYATHGHYLDCHLTIPTLERLSVGVMSRLLGRPPAMFAGAEDYEAVGAPVFAWRDAVARYTHPGAALNGMATVTAWQALGGGRAERRVPAGAQGPGALTRLGTRLRRRALVAAFPIAVAALNRAGIGPLQADISGEELRRAGLAAMGEAAERLGLGDAYVIFGHTHRPGPLTVDDEREWRGRGGARLVNCGSWTYASIFLRDTPQESPYWPGTCVLVDDQGPPQILRLLQDRSREQLRPPRLSAAQG
jgi:predicted phosphodiesterase